MAEEDAPDAVEEIGEEEEAARTRAFEELKPRLYRLVYNQPTILLSILEVIFDFLIDREIITREEADAIIKEGLRRWRDEIGAY